MASDADDLNLRERLRWGNPSKVYTRKRRRIQIDDPKTVVTASIAAEPEVTTATSDDGIRENEDHSNVLEPSLQTLEEADDPRFGEKLNGSKNRNLGWDDDVMDSGKVPILEPNGEVQEGLNGSDVAEAPRLEDSSACDLARGDGTDSGQAPILEPNGGELQEEVNGSDVAEAPRLEDSSACDLARGDGTDSGQAPILEPNGGELQEEVNAKDVAEEPRLEDSSACDLARGDGTDSGQVPILEPKGGELQEGLNGRDVAEGGGAPIVEPNGGDVRDGNGGGEPVVESYRDGTTRGHDELEVANGLVKPVITRVEDRVRINLTRGRSRDEVIDVRRALEGELDQIRSLVTKLEAKEVQLTTTHNACTNGGGINSTGRIGVIPGGAVDNSYSYPQYMDNDVIKSRSLVRANSEVGFVGHPGSRMFQPLRVAVATNSNGAAEFVEKEKRTPKANQYYRNSDFLLGKDRLPPESNKKLKPNGAGRKHSGELENGYASGFGFGFEKHRNQVFKRCSNLLQRLMKHKHSWVFNKPVDVQALGLHDYLDIIKHPMDFGTIKTRLSQNWYKSPTEFAEDVRLVFHNAKTYNPEGHVVHVMADELSNIFEERWAVIEPECNPDWRYQMYRDAGLPTPTSRKGPHPSPFARASVTSLVAPPAPQVRSLDRSESMTGPADFRAKPSYVGQVGRIPVPKKPKANDPNKRDMTYDEKQRLSTHLQSLPSEKLDAIVQIIKKRNSSLSQHDDEIEVDIDSVDAETLWELDRFVTNYKKNLSKQKRKAELALQARTGSAQTARVMNSAPTVAGSLQKGENNTSAPATNAEAGRQVDNASRSSSSSSSSSDSGSSSSDSDSDSSSGSDAGR